MKKLRLTPAASVTNNQNGVLLSSDLGDFQIHGRDVGEFINRVIPLLDGELGESEICEQLSDYAADSVKAVLGMLTKHGLLETFTEQQSFVPPGLMQERFLKPWQNYQTGLRAADYSLAEKRLLVVGLDPWSVKCLTELATAGVGHIHLLDKENLSEDDVVCQRSLGQENTGKPRLDVVKDYLTSENPWTRVTTSALTEENNLLQIENCDWDLVIVTLGRDSTYWSKLVSEFIHQYQLKAIYGHLDGLESWIGPVVNNEKGQNGSCWNCMSLRKLGTNEHSELAHELEKSGKKQRSARARSMLTPMSAMTGQQLAMEALKLLWNYAESDLVAQVLVQNLVTNEAEKHAIIPIPWCEVCGFDHNDAKLHPLNMIPKTPTHSQTSHGAMSAVASHTIATNPLNDIQDVEQFKSMFKGWIDPLTGIVRQLTGHARHLPDFPVTASAGVATFTQGEYDPRSAGQIGSGKGLDDISAHISAVGEALERYSASRYRVSDCKYASIVQLRGDYIDPETLVLYSKKQYASPGFPFHKWQRKQKIHWCQGKWLGTENEVWVPALVTYFNFACPQKEQFSQVSSNGLAAGQDNDDAAIRACYEMIERDAMMLTWYAKLPCKRLKYDSLYKGKMRVMIDEILALGIELECYLLDVGLHVPTVVCLAMGDGYRTPAVSVALATHGDIKVAMRKAILEQGHVMPYLCHLMRSQQKIPQHVSEVQSLEDHAAYYFSIDKRYAFDFMRCTIDEAIDVTDWQYPVVRNIHELKQRLDDAGIDVAVVDVTSPDMALSPFRVARAIGVNVQPIHFGEQFKRVDNPRLRKLLQGRPVNDEPHPIA